MHSRDHTNMQICRRVWARLRPLGFSDFTERTAWRYWHGGIDVVNFQTARGCVPDHDFYINLGVLLSTLPSDPWPYHQRSGHFRPLPQHFHFGTRLNKSILQPEFLLPAGYVMVDGEWHWTFRAAHLPGNWFIAADARNAAPVVGHAAEVIVEEGLPWLERFREPMEVLRILRAERGTQEYGWVLPRPRGVLETYIAHVERAIANCQHDVDSS
jgi:hypothetical protein